MAETQQPLKRSHARPQPTSCWQRVVLIGIFVLSLATMGRAQTTGARNSKSVLFLSSY